MIFIADYNSGCEGKVFTVSRVRRTVDEVAGVVTDKFLCHYAILVCVYLVLL